ncbi:MAG: neutral/alkaline non-lysosomal ceramidase N-terminal domain-containing protein [Pseudomonadales bacterium]|nr:neutral/alkaline non-lysosomal ceramidase N-terminal domain-containing protein [Pseudomonadales bacterium]
MRKLKWILGTLVVVSLLVLGGGLHAIWPFIAFPTTDIRLERLAALPAEDQNTLLAGVAVRDITTPIGIPKMGYSAWARQADGFRTRLKAKVFYIKPKQGLPVAVVQADLPASSLILHHRVAELIASKTDITAQALSIHVTHTHSGPGQFLDNDFYNAFGANKPGFDPDVYEFLAQQMADALIEAYETRKPAKIAVGETELYGATKNRSMGAYVNNKNVKDKSITEANALKAVNPAMTMVRIDLLEGEEYLPRGVFTSFAVHGTGIPAFTKPYHGDVWAFFERDLEWQIKQRYNTPWHPIHGPFESTHGDNNPHYEPGLRGDLESRRIGKLMAKAGWELFRQLDGELVDDLPVMVAMREVDVLNLRPQDTQGVLCDRAIAGTALVGAATGDEVFPISYLPPFRRGWPKSDSDDCHGEKNYMLSGLQPMGVEPERFPHLISISGIRVGKLVMVGLPYEVTFEAGNRIANGMAEATPEQAGVDYWVVSSHTNGFFGYATTREEYATQWYEGGHTIYGPGTTDFLKAESAKLVADMFAQPGLVDMPKEWQFSLATHHFSPPVVEAEGSRVQLTEPAFSQPGNNKGAYWSVEYLDVNPSQIKLHEPLIEIQVRTEESQPWQIAVVDGIPVTDEGYDLQIRYLEDHDKGMSAYELRWYHPTEAAGQYRFAVASRAGLPTFYSDIIQLP